MGVSGYMTFTILNIDTVVSNPNVRGGRPVIRNTGITVADLVLAHTSGDMLSAEQLALNFKLTLGEVYAALSYYYLHQDVIDNDIQHSAHTAQQLLNDLDTQGKLIHLE